MELNQQNKELYAQNKRISDSKRREERKREVREGRTSERRLAFLASIMEAYGINQKNLAELLGTTPQAVNWLLSVKDDMKISRAEEFMDKLGLSFRIEFKQKEPQKKEIQIEEKEFSSSGVKNTIRGSIIETMKFASADTPSYIVNYPEDGRLAFLANYLKTRKGSLSELCEQCGYAVNFFHNVFVRNDMQISQVFKIAQVTGQEIVWSIEQK